jgi:hypothetical protein
MSSLKRTHYRTLLTFILGTSHKVNIKSPDTGKKLTTVLKKHPDFLEVLFSANCS